MIVRRVVSSWTAALLLVGGAGVAAQNTPPAEDMQRARAILAELVAINTTDSERGDNTAAARALQRRLRDAGFPADDVRVVVPADAPRRPRATSWHDTEAATRS